MKSLVKGALLSQFKSEKRFDTSCFLKKKGEGGGLEDLGRRGKRARFLRKIAYRGPSSYPKWGEKILCFGGCPRQEGGSISVNEGTSSKEEVAGCRFEISN